MPLFFTAASIARACFMFVASGFSIITSTPCAAQKFTTSSCLNVEVKIATACGFVPAKSASSFV